MRKEKNSKLQKTMKKEHESLPRCGTLVFIHIVPEKLVFTHVCIDLFIFLRSYCC